MQPTTVTVLVETDKSARIEGARQLGVQPEDVNVVPVDEKTYAVSIKNMPGQFDIAVSEDKIEAAISTITPPLGNGKPVAVEDIEHALADLKIIFGIDKKIIKNCVSEVINTGTPCKNIQVAVGEPPKSGQDGRIDLKIGQDAVNKDPNSNMMVKPDQIVAVRIPAANGTPGKNIFGEEVPAKKGNEADFAFADNVIVAKDGNTLMAAIYGKAKLTQKNVSIENPVKVDKSGMWAKMSIFPTLADNSKLSYQDVCVTLEQVGVVSGIKEDSVIKAIEADEPFRDLTVAEAIPAKDGVNARIEFKFHLNGNDPETVDAARQDGSVPESSVIKELFSAGDVLAIKTLPEKPVHGSTITGKPLTGAEPKDKQITP
ncbi:MAG: FapA family protein, partial [Desulfobacterales bacterium]